MSIGFLHLHSLLRWFVLILLIVVIVRSFTGWMQKKPFTTTDNKLSLFLLIFTHLQLVIGFTLYFLKGWHHQFSNMKAAMSEATLRFWTVEHLVGMLLAITLITIGRISAKKATEDTTKFKRLALYNVFALLIILFSIPWAERGLF